jgi:TIMELESS-interacting protein
MSMTILELKICLLVSLQFDNYLFLALKSVFWLSTPIDDDNVNREDNDDRQDEPAEEGNAAFEGKVEDGGKKKEEEKKRIILNPQPKLDPTRICGTRGIGILQDAYSDFKPKGGDHVFEDLDKAMKRMEHWAHRLYPMLPFDDVMARISVLGKKMAVHVSTIIFIY